MLSTLNKEQHISHNPKVQAASPDMMLPHQAQKGQEKVYSIKNRAQICWLY